MIKALHGCDGNIGRLRSATNKSETCGIISNINIDLDYMFLRTSVRWEMGIESGGTWCFHNSLC